MVLIGLAKVWRSMNPSLLCISIMSQKQLLGNVCSKVIFRDQACASLWPTHAWLKTEYNYIVTFIHS